MSIATAIEDLSGRIQSAYDAVSAMGGEMPQTKDTYHLSAAIESIPAGDDSLLQFIDPTLSTGARIYSEKIIHARTGAFGYMRNTVDEINLPNLSSVATGNPPAPTLTGMGFASLFTATNPISIILPKLQNTHSSAPTTSFNNMDRLTHLDLGSVTQHYRFQANPFGSSTVPLEYLRWGVNQSLTGTNQLNYPTLKRLEVPNMNGGISWSAISSCTQLSGLEIGLPSNETYLNDVSSLPIVDVTLNNIYQTDYLSYTENTAGRWWPMLLSATVQHIAIGHTGNRLNSLFVGNTTLRHITHYGNYGICRCKDCTSLSTADINPSKNGPDTSTSRQYYYMFNNQSTFNGCTSLKKVNIYGKPTNVGTYTSAFAGVTNCAVTFYDVESDSDGDIWVASWLDFVSSTLAEFDHSNISYFPLRGTKIIWDEATSAWVETPDTDNGDQP